METLKSVLVVAVVVVAAGSSGMKGRNYKPSPVVADKTIHQKNAVKTHAISK